MFGWKRKAAPDQPVPEKVVLSSFDPPLVRAQKIWRLLGFVNDRGGFIPQMAAYLSHYRDLDAKSQADS